MTKGPRSASWPGGNQFRAGQVTTGSVAAAASAPVTLTWAVPMDSADYTVVASVIQSIAGTGTLTVHHIQSQTATAVVVRVVNDDGVSAHTGTLHVLAMGGEN